MAWRHAAVIFREKASMHSSGYLSVPHRALPNKPPPPFGSPKLLAVTPIEMHRQYVGHPKDNEEHIGSVEKVEALCHQVWFVRTRVLVSFWETLAWVLCLVLFQSWHCVASIEAH